MNAEILEHLKARLQTGPRSLRELHQLAGALGSTWSSDAVALALACLPDVVEVGDAWQLSAAAGDSTASDRNPIASALLALAGPTPMPAAALVARLPPGLIAGAAALLEVAKNHPQLEVIGGSRIRRR